MKIADKLGLKDEIFARMVVKTKMLFSNVIGHAAELHYEKYLKNSKIQFTKADTDNHFDYIVDNKKEQVKRWESAGTNDKFLAINLTQTHGDRSGEGNFYHKKSFDKLVAYDVLFKSFKKFDISEIETNKRFKDYIVGKFKIKRETENLLDNEQKEFLNLIKVKNKDYPDALEKYKSELNLNYLDILKKVCNLTLEEIDSLFTDENFRLVTGAKGFAAEEHFNVLLEKNKLNYKQDKDMYSKVDHWVGKHRVQVKIPNLRAVTNEKWAFKTHKSHGSGVKELYTTDEFDFVALFIGFNMNEKIDRYLPVSVKNEFLIIPTKDLPEHPDYPGHLKRVSSFNKDYYKVNDLSLLI